MRYKIFGLTFNFSIVIMLADTVAGGMIILLPKGVLERGYVSWAGVILYILFIALYFGIDRNKIYNKIEL